MFIFRLQEQSDSGVVLTTPKLTYRHQLRMKANMEFELPFI